MRWVAVWLVLAVAYAATAGVDAVEGERYSSDEARHLLIAESIVSDGDIDLADEYAQRDYEPFHRAPLQPSGELTGGRLHEPHPVGLPLLVAPAYALGGARGAELLLAALAALAFVLGGLLARQVVPEPWASGGTLWIGLGAPALAYGASLHSELLAGGALAAAVLFTVRAREHPRLGWIYGAAFILAALPWLGIKYLPAALVVLAALAAWTHRAGRRLSALIATEVVAASLVIYVTVNGTFYGGLTPYAALPADVSPTGAETPVEYLERAPRLLTLWLDPSSGLLRWSPALVLCGLALWLLWRSRRENLARAVPGRANEESAALLALAAVLAVFAVAVFGAPEEEGPWLSVRHLAPVLPMSVLFVAWGLRHAPRPVAYGIGALQAAVAVVLLAGGGSWAAP